VEVELQTLLYLSSVSILPLWVKHRRGEVQHSWFRRRNLMTCSRHGIFSWVAYAAVPLAEDLHRQGSEKVMVRWSD